ncbi:MAG: hypothetical protein V2I62_01965 [Bacteroidales bacterium]|nr:hypothetical protein [Bacteroidales bacterium]
MTFIAISSVVFIFKIGFSQDDCKVLVPEIAGQYIGNCKKGLAHGKGLAIGLDRYEGDFKKGFPDGKGTYVWSNGEVYTGEWQKGKRQGFGERTYFNEEDTLLMSGMWDNNEYMGPVPEKPKVLTSNGIERYAFQRQGDGNQITINFFINGSNNISLEDLSVIQSSGTMFRSGGTIGIESISFPLSCKISYYSWNKMHTSRVFSRFEFQITQTGRWVLNIHNN